MIPRLERTHFFSEKLPLPSPCVVDRIRQIEPDSNIELNYTIERSCQNNFLPRLGDPPKFNFNSVKASFDNFTTIAERRKMIEFATEGASKSPDSSDTEMTDLKNDFRTAKSYTREHQIADLSWYDDIYQDPEMGDCDYFECDPTNAASYITPTHLLNHTTIGGVDPKTPRTFTRFSKLPMELRLKILRYAAFTPRTVAVRCMEFSPNERKSVKRNRFERVIRIAQTKTNNAAAILQVNQELRKAALKFYNLCLGTLIYNTPFFGFYDVSFGYRIFMGDSDYLVRDPKVHINFVSDTLYLEDCEAGNALYHLLCTTEEAAFLPLDSIRSIAFDLYTGEYDSYYAKLLKKYLNIEELIFVARLNPSQLKMDNGERTRVPSSLARGSLELVELRREETLIHHERTVGYFHDRLLALGCGRRSVLHSLRIPKIRIMGLLSNGKRI
ncbi:hypothetical protein DSL72_002951 [Monilinia vaccinii-corymbosi]|uniref:2EXR domain-containing protein n=1 Tax=Monilinia vaccinii-corymbosi TaxID=61207 RepID=A0A8A3PE75_9HELO|nr:hypothetical protein DSL72_002951 [Monilinia vaccinii-corymbosi]